jgi:hypothetical protein
MGLVAAFAALAGSSVASYSAVAAAAAKKPDPRCSKAHKSKSKRAKCDKPKPKPSKEAASATLVIQLVGDGEHGEREYLRVTPLDTDVQSSETPINTATETAPHTVHVVPGDYQVAVAVWLGPTDIRVFRSETLTVKPARNAR